ncbi:MAG: MgtC/SapB family protein [Gemmatimonadetes bacterium]|nr:MgtC/SapB family protein [Gemmatimonadota bacterium]
MTGLQDVLNPFLADFWLRIGAAVLCGGVVGLERQLRGKPAGIRTSILICMGTQFFVTLGASFAGEHADRTRVLGQVVTGIGFLGGGVILAREGLVLGVTSAAVIWILAAIGAIIGLGHLAAAVALAFVTVAILVGVELLEATFQVLRQGVHAWRSNVNSRER